MMYDMIIIGGGPAGLAAALYAARQHMTFLLFADELGGLTTYVPELKTYLGYYYLTGYELIKKFKEHIAKYDVQIKAERVDDVRKNKKIFTVVTQKGRYSARTVIVATGRTFKHLGVKGEKKYLGKGLSMCAVCDGPLFTGKTVVVVGGGKHGLFSTLFLLRLVKKIYLIEKEKKLHTGGGMKHIVGLVKKDKRVKILLGAEVFEVVGDTFASGVVVHQGKKKKVVRADGVFVEVGYIPNTGFIKRLVKTNQRGEIIINEECRTSCKGMFAAGDVTQVKEKQVMVACGEGAKAVLSALAYLEESE